MRRPVGLLVCAVLLLWAALTYPAYRFDGFNAFLQSSAAVLLCLVPATGTMIWACVVGGRSPQKRLAASLGGSVVRMGVVLGGGLLLYTQWPQYFSNAFWLWVGIYYAATLTLEIFLLVKSLRPDEQSSEVRSEQRKIIFSDALVGADD